MNILNINTRNRKALGALTLPNETEAPDVCLLYSAHSQRCFRAHSSGTLGHLYSRAYTIRNGLVRGINTKHKQKYGACARGSAHAVIVPFCYIFFTWGVPIDKHTAHYCAQTRALISTHHARTLSPCDRAAQRWRRAPNR